MTVTTTTVDAPWYQGLLRRFEKGCVFCTPEPHLVLWSDEHLVLCADPAPIRAGHAVLFTRDHVGCAAEVEHDVRPHLDRVREELRATWQKAFGAVTVFEHGRAGHCFDGGPAQRLCHHFHAHLVPGVHEVAADLATMYGRRPVTDYGELPGLFDDYGDYIHVEECRPGATSSWFYAPGEKDVPAHLVRSLLAARLGDESLRDWSRYEDPTLLQASMTAARAAVGADVR